MTSSRFALLSLVSLLSTLLAPHGANALSWSKVTPDFTGDVGRDCAMALDGSNNPHIAYWDVTNAALKYATRSGANWSLTTIEDSIVTYNMDLVLGTSSSVHVAYTGTSPAGIRYAKYTSGSGWSTEAVTGATSGANPQIAVDTNNDPHITYWRADSLRHSWKSGGSWSTETIAPYGQGGDYRSDIRIDGSNVIHVVDSNNGTLVYWKKQSGTWTSTSIGSGLKPQFVLDSQGKLHVVVGTASDIQYKTNASGSWATETITSESEGPASIAVRSDDSPRVSYYANVSDLKYARLSGTWQTESVDTPNNVGLFNSIDMTSDDFPRIAYYDETNGNLKFAQGANEGGGGGPPQDGRAQPAFDENLVSLVIRSSGQVISAGSTYGVWCSVPAPSLVRFELLDAQGRVVGRSSAATERVGWHHLELGEAPTSAGVYFLRATSGPWSAATRIVVR